MWYVTDGRFLPWFEWEERQSVEYSHEAGLMERVDVALGFLGSGGGLCLGD